MGRLARFLVLASAAALISCTPAPVSPTPSGTIIGPSILPTTSPAATGIARELEVDSDRGDPPMAIRFIDRSGRVDDAEAAPVELVEANLDALLESQIAAVDGPDEQTVLVLWSGFACVRSGAIVVETGGGAVAVSPDPMTDCDLVPSHRGVVITFAAPMPAASLRVLLDPTPLLPES